jgi:hypothetical protein
MNIAIVTMVYNERVNLPIWIRHYSAHCPGAALFVIDHGSDDGSTRGLGVNLVPLPRSPFDDQTRAEFVADFQHALLRFYDVVIYTDCDEMLVADPREHVSLASFLAATGSAVIAPTGMLLLHLPGVEPPIDLSAPILGQRRYVEFRAGMCKPSIARVPLHWAEGFHSCDRMPDYRTDLYQFHLAAMDVGVSRDRWQVTRTMAWSERALSRGWAAHQRRSDGVRLHRLFEVPAEHIKTRGAAPFAFEADLRHLVDSIRVVNGFYQLTDFFGGPIAQVPEAFFGLI